MSFFKPEFVHVSTNKYILDSNLSLMPEVDKRKLFKKKQSYAMSGIVLVMA